MKTFICLSLLVASTLPTLAFAKGGHVSRCERLIHSSKLKYEKAWNDGWDINKPDSDSGFYNKEEFVLFEGLRNFSRGLTKSERKFLESVTFPVTPAVRDYLRAHFKPRLEALVPHVRTYFEDVTYSLDFGDYIDGRMDFEGTSIRWEGIWGTPKEIFSFTLKDVADPSVIEKKYMDLRARVARDYLEIWESGVNSADEYARKFSGAGPECFADEVQSAQARARAIVGKSPESVCEFLIFSAAYRFNEEWVKSWKYHRLDRLANGLRSFARGLTKAERKLIASASYPVPKEKSDLLIRVLGPKLRAELSFMEEENADSFLDNRLFKYGLDIDATHGKSGGIEIVGTRTAVEVNHGVSTDEISIPLQEFADPSIDSIEKAIRKILLKRTLARLKIPNSDIQTPVGYARLHSGAGPECFAENNPEEQRSSVSDLDLGDKRLADGSEGQRVPDSRESSSEVGI